MEKIKNIIIHDAYAVISDNNGNMTLITSSDEKSLEEIFSKEYELDNIKSRLSKVEGYQNANTVKTIVSRIFDVAGLSIAGIIAFATIATQPLFLVVVNMLIAIGAVKATSIVTCGTKKSRQTEKGELEEEAFELKVNASTLEDDIEKLKTSSRYVERFSTTEVNHKDERVYEPTLQTTPEFAPRLVRASRNR